MRLFTVLCVGLLVAISSTKVLAQEGSSSRRDKMKNRWQKLVRNGKQRGKSGRNQTRASKAGDKNRQNNSKSAAKNNPNDPQFQPKPDLVPLYVIDQGNHAVIAVQNRGNWRSRATNVRLYVSSLGAEPSQMKFADLPALEPNETKLLRVRGLKLVRVTMIAQVDYPNLVNESNERNNSANHVVNEKPEELADLAITKIQFFPDSKEVWVTVRNNGRKTVPRAPLHLTPTFGLKEGPRLRHTVENLKPGIFMTYRFFPQEMNRGTQFVAVVDGKNRVPEIRENNNRLVRTF